MAESTAPAQRQEPRQTTLVEAGKQKLQPPVDNDAADVADDDVDDVPCAEIQIRTDQGWLPQSHALSPRTNYCSSAVHSAILSGGRSSRSPLTSPLPTPDPACPTPADRRCRSTADPPRSRPQRSRIQTTSTTTTAQQVRTRRRRLSLASRSTTTP